MKHKKVGILLVGLSVLMCLSGSTLLAMPRTEVTNHFSTGIVDIDLKEYQVLEGKEVLYEDVENILPGQTISKIPRIYNEGNSCYLRVKLILEDTNEEIEIQGMSDKWVACMDGYFYYKDVLKTGDSVDLFQSVKVPAEFTQEEEGEKFRLKIDADAIQSEHVTPDFQASAPWGAVEIQQCKKEGQYDINAFKKADNQSLQVEYKGDTGKLLSKPDDFFTNFPIMIPGDIHKDSATLSNDSNTPIRLYFKSAALNDQELLNQIQLRITTQIDGAIKTVYDGSLKAEELETDQLLGMIPAKSSGNFEFQISAPPELDNEYTVLTNQVKWIFSTEPIKEEVLTEVQTGIAKKAGLFLLLSGVALGTATILFCWKGRKHEASRKGNI